MFWNGLFTCLSPPPDYEILEGKDLGCSSSVCQRPTYYSNPGNAHWYSDSLILWFDVAAGFVSRNELG